VYGFPHPLIEEASALDPAPAPAPVPNHSAEMSELDKQIEDAKLLLVSLEEKRKVLNALR
jgi:hypothetical protein